MSARATIAIAMLLGLLTTTSVATSARSDLTLSWLRDGRVETRASAGAGVTKTPLGSVWKLFVYAYAIERGMETPPYRCGRRSAPSQKVD